MSENRLIYIDNLRGLAFLLMVFQHIFYFYDVSNNFETLYSSNFFVSLAGIISRTTFILLAGISVYMAYERNKNNFINKRFYRSLEILGHACIISLVTYLLYPNLFVRFGILHFLALATLLISFLAPYKILSVVILIITIIILFTNYPDVNSFIDTITGAQIHFPMMDWFPLNHWLPVILIGLIFAQNINLDQFIFKQQIFNNKNILTSIGKNSLNFYTIHIILLLVFYKILV